MPASKKKANKPETDGRSKTKCPITREQFLDNAKGVPIAIGDAHVTADPKDFSTGSFGWFSNAKVEISVGGVPVRCQLNCVLTAIGSKDTE